MLFLAVSMKGLTCLKGECLYTLFSPLTHTLNFLIWVSCVFLDSSMMEHILPDSLFASPTKFSADERSPFVNASTSTAHNDCLTPPTSALKSCFLEIPRFA